MNDNDLVSNDFYDNDLVYRLSNGLIYRQENYFV